MYKISYEKCVCFIFLVILAVLSCSGFRIDNLAMTDISKRNSHTSNSLTSSDEFFNKMFNVNRTQSFETATSSYHHRIRHHRQLRAQAHTFRRYDSQKPPTGHIDVIVYPPTTTQPNEHYAQIPSTALQNPFFPTRSIISRPQRSSHTRKPRKHRCHNNDISRKIYLSPIVVLAKVESMRKEKHTYYFKVIDTFKNSSMPVDDHIQLILIKNNNATHCERTDIQQQKEYLLFLNSTGAHLYSAFELPAQVRRKEKPEILKMARRITSPNFKPIPTQIVKLDKIDKQKRYQLVCKTKGFPIPEITWSKNGTDLQRNRSYIIYNRKRRSTLVVKNLTDKGPFECNARGVDGTKDKRRWPPDESKKGICKGLGRGFCHGHGNCDLEESMQEYYCQCDAGYRGQFCEFRDHLSTYHQPTQYACNLGLQTKYFC